MRINFIVIEILFYDSIDYLFLASIPIRFIKEDFFILIIKQKFHF
ncbi:hypothetical protein LEP1GSC120_2629 [Leptospira santarosai str. 200702252]|nr:hypothetical protein LEP1GSC130_1549 [Leptospira santarosai str. 200403458]EMO99994.1 hypothetical protein LEP1GSC120_2629 [Leptospira santarosai str. 200702252]